MSTVRTRVRIPLATGFAFISGWADSTCLIRYNAFATMMTGNFFQLGYTLIYPKIDYDDDPSTQLPKHRIPDPAFYSAVITAYFSGLLLFRLSEGRFPHRTGCVFGPAFAVIITAFEIFTASTINENGTVGEEARWIVCFLAPVFAVQNMLSLRGGLNTPTAYLTGHLQNLGSFVFDALVGNVTLAQGKKHMEAVLIIAFVVIGAVAGALWNYFLGTVLALVMAVLFLVHDCVFRPPPAVDVGSELQPDLRTDLVESSREVISVRGP